MRLVHDLALSIPAPADGGRTYAFRIRSGIRYSDGQPLRASNFWRATERLFRVHSPGATYYAGLVGAAACTLRPASCDLSCGIVADDAHPFVGADSGGVAELGPRHLLSVFGDLLELGGAPSACVRGPFALASGWPLCAQGRSEG